MVFDRAMKLAENNVWISGCRTEYNLSKANILQSAVKAKLYVSLIIISALFPGTHDRNAAIPGCAEAIKGF